MLNNIRRNRFRNYNRIAAPAAPSEPPTVVMPPSTSGGTGQTATLTATPGEYGGTEPITVTRQWYRSNAIEIDVAISGETGLTYTKSAVDIGHSIYFLEYASNAFGGPLTTPANEIGPTVATDTDVADYITRLIANGGAVNSTEAVAVNNFILGLKTDSIWTSLRRGNLMVGPNLASAAIPIKNTYGAVKDTLTNYASGDWNRVTGLRGNGAGSARIDTGWTILAEQRIGWWAAKNTGSTISSSGSALFGASSVGTNLELGFFSTQIRIRPGTPSATGQMTYGANLPIGIHGCSRASTVLSYYFEHNNFLASNAASIPSVDAVWPLWFGNENSAGSALYGLSTSQRLAGYMCYDYLGTGANHTAAMARWDTFNTALGR